MNLDDILEKIKRIENSSSSNNIVYFIVACDLLYFLKDNDKRERFIHEYYKNDTNMFTNNFKKVCYYAESILLEDEVYDNMLKSIEMDVYREDLVSMYNYYDAIERIEKANHTPKDMVSDGFKIRVLKNVFDASNREYQSLSNNVKDLKNRYDRNLIDMITIIAIFIAVSIGMVSGISFSLQAFDSLTNTNIVSVATLVLVVGFVIFNLFYALFRFVSKICGKEFDNKSYIIFIDVVFILLICFFVFLSAK